MAEYNINKIKLPNGDIVKLVDETSGYAKSSEVPTVVDTYSSTGTDAVSGKAVNAALQTLDSSITATTGQAISAITITDGKIASSSKINVGETNLVNDVQIGGASILSSKVANIVTNSTYNSSTNKIATMSDVGEVNQNAFSNVKVGSTTIAADTTTDTLELVAGTDITLTPDATNDKVTIAFNNSSGYITSSSLPTVNDGNLKLQKNSEAATNLFSANQSGDATLKWTTTSVGSASNWSAGTVTTIDTSKFSGGSFTQGTDSFTTNTPTVIDTSKFSGGSFTRGTFSGGSFTQGTDSFTKPTHGSDSFTAATMTSTVGSTNTTVTSPTTMTISFTGGSYTQGTFTQGSFTQGTDSFTAATHAADSFTAAALQNGFYTAGSAASFTQGTDSHTAASLGSGFYSAGTAPSLTVTSTAVVNGLSKV